MLAKASEVFGSQDKVEEWFNKPAMGLDGHRPIELPQTVLGTERAGGCWNPKGMHVVDGSFDPVPTVLEVAVSKGPDVRDSVAH